MRELTDSKHHLLVKYRDRLIKHILFSYTPEEFIKLIQPVLNGSISLNDRESMVMAREMYDIVIPEPEDDTIVYAHSILLDIISHDGISPEELPSGISPDEFSPDEKGADQGDQAKRVELLQQEGEVISKISVKEIVDWFDRKCIGGAKVELYWWGGDERFYGVLVDEEEVGLDEDMYDKINELLNSALGYGWGSGEFNGEAIYDSETKTFVGSHLESLGESLDGFNIEGEIKILLPKTKPFDYVEISSDNYGCLEAFLKYRNGGGVRDSSLVDSIISQFQSTLDSLNTDDSSVVCFDRNTIPRTEFIEDGDDLVFVLREIKLKEKYVERREIEVDLKKMLD